MSYAVYRRYSRTSGLMEDFHVSIGMEYMTEMERGRLYFGVTFSDKTELIKSTPETFYFNIDEELVYMNYYLDFGPYNLSCLYKYCMKLQSYMQCAHIKRVIHYTARDPNKRANAAFLIGAYAIIFLKMDPKIAYRKLLEAGGPYRPFVDASQGTSRYTLKLLECLQGIQRAHSLNFFDFNDFNSVEYDLYDKIQNGDFNWLVPRKFLALIGPIDKEISTNGHAPNFYIKYFLKNDVRTVIRLNNKLYDAIVFTNAGIDHHDLFFPDGTTPPKQILLRFLEIAEKSPGAIAVHCKAGLGRTGSLIGAYIMKHYRFSAKEAIAWLRICRPGSVIGQQQGWLEKIEGWLWKEGLLFRLECFGDSDKLPHHKYGVYSKVWQVNRKKMLFLAQKRIHLQWPFSNGYSCMNYDVMNAKAKLNTFNGVPELASPFVPAIENEVDGGDPPTRGRSKNSLEKTQGDMLVDIKFRKYLNNMVPDGKYPNKTMDTSQSRVRGICKQFESSQCKLPLAPYEPNKAPDKQYYATRKEYHLDTFKENQCEE